MEQARRARILARLNKTAMAINLGEFGVGASKAHKLRAVELFAKNPRRPVDAVFDVEQAAVKANRALNHPANAEHLADLVRLHGDDLHAAGSIGGNEFRFVVRHSPDKGVGTQPAFVLPSGKKDNFHIPSFYTSAMGKTTSEAKGHPAIRLRELIERAAAGQGRRVKGGGFHMD
ncbi:MAG: hypothetical protein ABID40_02465 [Candidatus Bipolaricaulota bacterium]